MFFGFLTSLPVFGFLFVSLALVRKGQLHRARRSWKAKNLKDQPIEALGARNEGRFYTLERDGVVWYLRRFRTGDTPDQVDVICALPLSTAAGAAPRHPLVRVGREAPVDALLKWLSPGLDLEVGDADFDAEVLLHTEADDAPQVRAWLSGEEARKAVLQLFSGTCSRISVCPVGAHERVPVSLKPVMLQARFWMDPCWESSDLLSGQIDMLRVLRDQLPEAAAPPLAPRVHFGRHLGLAGLFAVLFLLVLEAIAAYPPLQDQLDWVALMGMTITCAISSGAGIYAARRSRIKLPALVGVAVWSWLLSGLLVYALLLWVNGASDPTLADHPTTIAQVKEHHGEGGRYWRATLAAVPGIDDSLSVSLSKNESQLAQPGSPCILRAGAGRLGVPWRQSLRCTFGGESHRLLP